MPRTIVRPAARRDLIRHFAHIGENGGLGAARRFLGEARRSFLELAHNPHLGVLRGSQKFPTLRMWRVGHFEKYLIFYLPVENGVRIERLLHASQDYTRFLPPGPPG